MENNKESGVKKIIIIVIIVAALAFVILAIRSVIVILTLNDNAPIEPSKESLIYTNIANIQALLTNKKAKLIAKNQASIYFKNANINANLNEVGKIEYGTKNDEGEFESIGFIIFDEGEDNNTTCYFGKKLLKFGKKETIWNFNEKGDIEVKIDGKIYKSRKDEE